MLYFSITSSIGDPGFSVTLASPIKLPVSTLMDILDRKDGLYIVRFRLIDSANDIEVSVTYKNQHVADSPYQLQGNIAVVDEVNHIIIIL